MACCKPHFQCENFAGCWFIIGIDMWQTAVKNCTSIGKWKQRKKHKFSTAHLLWKISESKFFLQRPSHAADMEWEKCDKDNPMNFLICKSQMCKQEKCAILALLNCHKANWLWNNHWWIQSEKQAETFFDHHSMKIAVAMQLDKTTAAKTFKIEWDFENNNNKNHSKPDYW